MEKMRVSGCKAFLGRFQLDTRGTFFTRTISHWNHLPRELVESPLLAIFKVHLDKGAGPPYLEHAEKCNQMLILEVPLNLLFSDSVV